MQLSYHHCQSCQHDITEILLKMTLNTMNQTKAATIFQLYHAGSFGSDDMIAALCCMFVI
jgi:hypothetical protein